MSKQTATSKPRTVADDVPEAQKIEAGDVGSVESAVGSTEGAATAAEPVADPLASERAELARMRADLEKHEDQLREAAKQISAERDRLSSLGVDVDAAASAPVAASEDLTATDGLPVFSVRIPNCLLGERFFVAGSPEEAYGKYKALGGITKHESQHEVKRITTRNPAYAIAVEAHNAALAAEAERKAAEALTAGPELRAD